MNPLFLLVLMLALFLIWKMPGALLMIGLTIFFNIGNYIDRNSFGFPNYFTFHEFGLVLAVLAGLKTGDYKRIKKSHEFRRILLILFLFSMYQIIVSIMINLNTSFSSTLIEIAYHKWIIFGVFTCVPMYFIIQYYSKTIYKYIVLVSFIVLLCFFLTITTPLKLIEIFKLDREFVGASRVWFENYGYMQFIIILGLVVYIFKIKVELKWILFIAGIAMFISILITFTRGTIIQMFGVILLCFIIGVRVYRIKVSNVVFYSTLFGGVALITMFLLFPGSLGIIFDIFNLSLKEMTGQIREGTTQSRTSFELLRLGNIYMNNIWFGTGFLREYFDAYGTTRELGLADLAIVGNLALYGTIGFFIYFLRYITLHKYIKNMFVMRKNQIFTLDRYEFILLICCVVYLYGMIFFSLINFSIDLVYNERAIMIGLVIGIIYGLNEKYPQSNEQML